MKIVLLLPDLFDAVGGIQTFSRALVAAVDGIAHEHGWHGVVLVLNDKGNDSLMKGYLQSGRITYRAFRRRKTSFALSAISHALNASMVVTGHVHFSPLIAAVRCVRPRLNVFLLAYGIEAWEKFSPMRRLFVGMANRVLSISACTRDQLLYKNRLNASRLAILPCTLDPMYGRTMAVSSRERLPLPFGKMILSVARLSASERYKGVDKVIRALPLVLREVPDVFYVVVGDGDDRRGLEKLADDCQVANRVFFTGWVPEDLLRSYYEACDVFVLPSTGEGFGIVFLEAMYHGKACVGARSGGVPEVIEDGKTGFLTAPDDVEMLANRLVRLVSNKTLCRAFGEAGRERFEQRFSFDLFRKRLETALCA